jgi:hypothetical protein
LEGQHHRRVQSDRNLRENYHGLRMKRVPQKQFFRLQLQHQQQYEQEDHDTQVELEKDLMDTQLEHGLGHELGQELRSELQSQAFPASSTDDDEGNDCVNEDEEGVVKKHQTDEEGMHEDEQSKQIEKKQEEHSLQIHKRHASEEGKKDRHSLEGLDKQGMQGKEGEKSKDMICRDKLCVSSQMLPVDPQ